MRLRQVGLGLLYEVVFILAGDCFAAGAVQVSLHIFTIAYISKMETMDLSDVMRTTGAVREYTDDPLPDEVLERILDNARFSPSGGDRHGTHPAGGRKAPAHDPVGEFGLPGA